MQVMQKQTEELDQPQQTTLVQDLIALARYGLMGRRGLIIFGGGLAVGGVFLGWDWLVAAGLAPILLSVLPCVAVCAVAGVCMSRTGSKSRSSTPDGNSRKSKLKTLNKR